MVVFPVYGRLVVKLHVMLGTVIFNGQSKQNSYSIAVVSYMVSLIDKFSLWAVGLPVFVAG